MVKVISLSNEAYERLKGLKYGKSFSESIIDLIEKKKKKSIMEFVGIWKNDDKYWENFKKEVRKTRNKMKLREVKF